jgi:hypothetical protein
MRSVVYTITGVGNSNVMAPDPYISPFNVALNVAVTGTVTYTVQYTFDNVFAAGYNPANGSWTNHPSLTAQTATKDSNISYPVTGIRLTTTAGTTGTATLTIIQAGGGGNA